MKKLFDEIFHFGIIGVFNTVAGYILVLIFLNVWNWNYWVASGTSYVIGSIFSYFANKKLTFKVEENSWKRYEGVFAGSYAEDRGYAPYGC